VFMVVLDTALVWTVRCTVPNPVVMVMLTPVPGATVPEATVPEARAMPPFAPVPTLTEVLTLPLAPPPIRVEVTLVVPRREDVVPPMLAPVPAVPCTPPAKAPQDDATSSKDAHVVLIAYLTFIIASVKAVPSGLLYGAYALI